MSSRELLRVGLVLLGVYLIVSALAGVSAAFGDRPLVMGTGDRSSVELLGGAVLSLALGLVGAALFGVLPGFVLIAKSGAWAARLSQDEEGRLGVPPSLLLGVGCILLGIDFALRGAAGLVGASAALLASLGLEDTASVLARGSGVRTLGASIVHLLAGVVLVVWGRGRLARPVREPTPS